jgi:hypothetical protein
MNPETQMEALTKALVMGVKADSHAQMVDLVRLAELLCLGLTPNQVETSKLNAEISLERSHDAVVK